MTAQKNLKKRIRAYAAEHGLSYTRARDRVLALDAADGRPPSFPPGGLPPAPPSGPTPPADDEWPEPPTDEELVTRVMAGLFEDLLNEPIGPYGLPVPEGLPTLRDPWIHTVSARPSTLELDYVEDYDGDTMSNATMRGDVILAGELDTLDATALEAQGVVRRLWPGHDDYAEVTVAVIEQREMQIEAGVLHERVGELAELQEVFSRTWVID